MSISSAQEEVEEEPINFISTRVYKEFGLEVISTQNNLSIGPRVKMGANFYFMDRYMYGLGINVSFTSFAYGIGPNFSIYGTTPGLGPSLLIRTREDAGFEFNLPVTYGGFQSDLAGNGQGICFAPEFKWRKNDFTIGVHYTSIIGRQDFGGNYFDTFGISFGTRLDPERFINNLFNSLNFLILL